jgi:hypothetical protein
VKLGVGVGDFDEAPARGWLCGGGDDRGSSSKQKLDMRGSGLAGCQTVPLLKFLWLQLMAN